MRVWVIVGMALGLASCGSHPPEYQIVASDGSEIWISHEVVADGEPHFFTYKHKGTNVNFIVRTDGDGQLHTHFDACFSCYRYKRGFIVEDADLVCVACRYAYPIDDDVWDFIGACAPINFHFSLKSDSVVIEQKILDKGSRFFS